MSRHAIPDDLPDDLPDDVPGDVTQEGSVDAPESQVIGDTSAMISDVAAAPARGDLARSSLIEAGIVEFGELGPKGASIRKIAARAGQNVAAIAYYFGSKQGLYLAIVASIGDKVTRRTEPLLDEIDEFLARTERPPARCLAYLLRMLAGTLDRNDEMVALSQIVVREQTHPTAAFDILYQRALERPHRTGSRLIAAYAGSADEDAQEFVLRYHLLLGSVLAFRVARETLLRRLAWTDISPDDKMTIEALEAEHVELVLGGIRARAMAARTSAKDGGVSE